MHSLNSQLLDYVSKVLHTSHSTLSLISSEEEWLFLWKSTISFAWIVPWRSLFFLKFAIYLFMGSLSYLDSSRFSQLRFVTSKLCTLLQLSNYKYMFENFVCIWHPMLHYPNNVCLGSRIANWEKLEQLVLNIKMRKASASSRPLLFLLPDLMPI